MTKALDLPVPLNRTELFLAKIAGEDVTPPEPQSRQEMFLAKLAGADIVLPEPLSLTEQWLALCAGMAGVTAPEIEGACLIGVQKVDVRFFAVASGLDGVTAPEPQNRTEVFWAKIAEEMSVKTITVKGTNLHLLKVVSGIDDLQYVYGDTSQQTYTGKNLLPYPFSSGGSNPRGITFTTNSDGSVTLNGQNDRTGQTVYFLFNNSGSPMPLSAGTYYFAPPANTAISYLIYDGSYHGFSSSNNYTQTFNSDTSVRQIYITVPQGNTTNFNNFKIYPMLTTLSGQTEADYEPYVGGIASPNPEYPQDVKVVTGEQVVDVHGKNLFNIGTSINDYFLTSRNGTTITNELASTRVTATFSSDSMTINSYSTAGWRWLSKWLPLTRNTDYTISASSHPAGIKIFGFNSKLPNTVGTQIRNFQTSDNSATFNSGDYDYYLISIYPNGADSTFSQIQIEQGSSPTQFESFTRDTFTINFGNLFNPKTIMAGDIKGGNSTIRLCSTQVLWLEAGEYTFSTNLPVPYQVSLSVNSVGAPFLLDYPTYSYNSGWVTAGTTTYTFTTSEDGWFVLQLRESSNNTLTVNDISGYNFQLNRGTSVITPIELCKIGDYQDYIYKSGSDWYVHKEVGKNTYDGTESWTWDSSVPRIYTSASSLDIKPVTGNDKIVEAICNKFIAGSITRVVFEKNNGFALSTSTLISFVDKSWSNQSDAITDINNTTLFYVLATPTDTQITDSTLISQLNALDSAILPTPEAFVTVSGNLPAPIQFTYEGKE